MDFMDFAVQHINIVKKTVNRADLWKLAKYEKHDFSSSFKTNTMNQMMLQRIQQMIATINSEISTPTPTAQVQQKS